MPYGFGSCTSDFTGTLANCCDQSDPASCFASFQQSQGYGDACLTIEYSSVAYSKANPGFDNASYQQQAECVCYDSSGNYTPDLWDDAAASLEASPPSAVIQPASTTSASTSSSSTKSSAGRDRVSNFYHRRFDSLWRYMMLMLALLIDELPRDQIRSSKTWIASARSYHWSFVDGLPQWLARLFILRSYCNHLHR